MFNGLAADYLQAFAWPLEFIAIALLVTGNRFPEKLHTVETAVDNLVSSMEGSGNLLRLSVLFSLSGLLFIVTPSLAYGGVWAIVTLIGCSSKVLVHYIYYQLTNENGVTTLAFVLALIAFSFETYQFITLLIG